jgi:hypothetical protein
MTITVTIERLSPDVKPVDIINKFKTANLGLVTCVKMYKYNGYNSVRVQLIPILESDASIKFEDELNAKGEYTFDTWFMKLLSDIYLKIETRPDGFIYYKGELLTVDEYIAECYNIVC